MGIMDMFRGLGGTGEGTASAIPPAGDPSATNPTAPGAAVTKSDGKGPAAFPDTTANVGEKSPLDGFTKLWEKSDTDAKPISSLVPSMTVDGRKLMEAAAQVDFAKVIPADVLQKAISGDASAFAQAINLTSQASFAQSAAATAKIVEQALQRQADTFKNEVMPDILRKERVSNTLRQDNPLFENPAVAPMLGLLEERLQQKFPSASAQEIKSKAQDYMSGLAGEIAKANGQTLTALPTEAERKSKEDYDWGSFFGTN